MFLKFKIIFGKVLKLVVGLLLLQNGLANNLKSIVIKTFIES
jgi:hypothetical protein